MRVVHITTGLGNGGSEGMLYRICREHNKILNQEIHVINLSDNDWYESRLKKIGIKIHKVYFKKNILDIFQLILLAKLLVKLKPNIIQTWMYHANFIGGILGYCFTKAKIFWNIRHTRVSFQYSKLNTILIVNLSSFISLIIPKKIIYCSLESKKVHEDKNYDKKKGVFIPNGYDDTFFPSKFARKTFRKKYKLKKNNFVIGLAARYHKEKNFKNLINAFNLFSRNNNKVLLFLKGKNVSIKNSSLKENLSVISKKKFKLINNSKNILDFMNGIDLFVLPSFSESFPNVLAEAMLCETPCISTNVGAARDILYNSDDSIVPIDNSFILNKAIEKKYLIFKKKKRWNLIKKKSRKKIINNYNIKDISSKYLKLWNKYK